MSISFRAMGAFYGSMLVTGMSTTMVVDYLRRGKRSAYVLGVSSSQCLIWDKRVQGFDDVVHLHLLATLFSLAENTTVVTAINQDDDLLGLSLYRGGGEIDLYMSNPELVDEQKGTVGDADLWCDTLNTPLMKPKLRALFASEEFTFEIDRHAAIAETFEWPVWVVGVSYDDIESGATPDGFPVDQLLHITPA